MSWFSWLKYRVRGFEPGFPAYENPPGIPPKKEPKRYKVNKYESVWDMNKLVPRKTVVVWSKKFGEINLDDYEILSYQCGNALLSGKHLTWRHFDAVHPMFESMHPIKKEKTLTLIGYRGDYTTILIAKKL